MKQPLWKVLASYLTDIHIESSSSFYNEELHVLLSKGRYQLCTDEAIYSYADKYINFKDFFDQSSSLNADKLDVLVLGLGLGSIPYMIEKIYGHIYNYTLVEIDEEVIYLAHKYVLKDLKSDFEVITSDAQLFMQSNSRKYDLICMDIFNSADIPVEFQTLEFTEHLKSSLTKEGILVYNRLYHLEDDITSTDAYFNTIFKKVFKQAGYLTTMGNKMLVNNKRVITTK